MNARTQSRSGYTLIELLVVIGIIAALAAITVAFLPSVAANAAEARAAIQLQGWLNIAKQRALRDQAPRGLRLWPSAANPLQCIECQYIEQPDDFNDGVIASDLAGSTITFGGMTNDLYNGYPPLFAGDTSQMKYWNVQPGDFLEVLGTGLMHQITLPMSANQVTITPALLNPITTATPNYRIVRAPRVVGDETLKLPDGTIIDGQTNITYSSALPVVYEPGSVAPIAVDILFSPSGAVISRGISGANLNLWVRAPADVNPADAFAGSPTIVSIYMRTGFIGAYNIARQGSPYSLVD